LARKAPRLVSHTSLTGWLYTSARFQAGKARRAEHRRHLREQESHAMSQLLQTSETEILWREMRPALDDVMHQLNDADREALLLRYFERKPLAEVGARLGLSENAARMRIERALDKVRALLSKRGITSTAAALAIALTERAVAAAPAALVSQVSRAALAAVATGGVVTGLIPTALKWLAGAAIVVTVGFMVWTRHAPAASQTHVPPSLAAVSQTISSNSAQQNPVATIAQTTVLDTTNKLTLHVVAADSGQPVPMVDLDFWISDGRGVHHLKELHVDRFGNCDVPVARAATAELTLVSERDGFADTRLQWHVDHGDVIPQTYTLRLERAVPIGGQVVDADGNPVVGAKIAFDNHGMQGSANPSSELSTETTDFTWPFSIETTSDAAGHWQVDRLAKGVLRSLDAYVTHPEHAASGFGAGNDGRTVQQLIAGAYVFRMSRSTDVGGDVTDSSGNPIADAHITVGYGPPLRKRSGDAGRDGTFSLRGCLVEETFITAAAPGFAAAMISANLYRDHGPFHLTLQPGKTLRLRVVDSEGQPVPQARVIYNSSSGFPSEPLPVQTEFDRLSDNQGLVEWDSAPDTNLEFNIFATGHSSGRFHARPDGTDHVFTLAPPFNPLTISGSVLDAVSGKAIPSFRIITGWPVTNATTGGVTGRWSEFNQDWLRFQGGVFRYKVDHPLNTPNRSYILKFEADGYAPFVSRPVGVLETNTNFQVAMQPAPIASVTVTTPDGQPAAQAEVGFVSPHSNLMLTPGGFRQEMLSVGRLIAADNSGHFTWTVDPDVSEIIIAHPRGFAQLSAGELTNEPAIKLQSWGRIEGTLITGGQPAAHRLLHLEFGPEDRYSIRFDLNRFGAETDDAGRFSFPQVPPGPRDLDLGRADDTDTGRLLTNLDVPPGETVTLNIAVPDPLPK
jgi:RNA polymerase sigma factor (sigma-70 family)